MSLLSFRNVSAVLLAVLAYQLVSRMRATETLGWHEGPEWTTFLDVYDGLASQYLLRAGCKSQTVATTFGNSQVWLCGMSQDKQNEAVRPVLLFHGAGSNSLVFSEWLGPRLWKRVPTVLVDYPCDVGRGSPLNSNTSTCPQDMSDTASWVQQLHQKLELQHPAALVGYSYGAYVAASVAIHAPEIVERLVFVAPAPLFAPLQPGFLFRAVAFAIYPGPWFYNYLAADPNFSYEEHIPLHQRKHMEALKPLTGRVVLVNLMDALPDSEFERIKCPMQLIIGENEKITDPAVSVQRARNMNVQTELLPQAGHLLLIEQPAASKAEDLIEAFLFTEAA